MSMHPINLKPKKQPKLSLAFVNYDCEGRTALTAAKMKLMSASIMFARDPNRETRQQWTKRVGEAFGLTHLEADSFLNVATNRMNL
jgi:hypothetical protein